MSKIKEIKSNHQIAFISAVNILSNLVLIENGYFDGAEFTKDEVEQMTHLDNKDLVILSEYKEQATVSLKELFGDINDSEYVNLALEKLEEVTTNFYYLTEDQEKKANRDRDPVGVLEEIVKDLYTQQEQLAVGFHTNITQVRELKKSINDVLETKARADSIVQQNASIALGYIVITLCNRVLFDQGYFNNSGLSEDELLSLVLLDEDDIAQILEYKQETIDKAKELCGDEPERLALILEKIEEVVTDCRTTLEDPSEKLYKPFDVQRFIQQQKIERKIREYQKEVFISEETVSPTKQKSYKNYYLVGIIAGILLGIFLIVILASENHWKTKEVHEALPIMNKVSNDLPQLIYQSPQLVESLDKKVGRIVKKVQIDDKWFYALKEENGDHIYFYESKGDFPIYKNERVKLAYFNQNMLLNIEQLPKPKEEPIVISNSHTTNDNTQNITLGKSDEK